MTEQTLKNYLGLTKEILMLDMELEKEQERLEEIQTRQGAENLLCNLEENSQKIQRRLYRQIDEKYHQRMEIEKWIEEIPDSRLRCVFRLRYLSGLKWREVAGRMGMCDEQTPRMMAARYLGKF